VVAADVGGRIGRSAYAYAHAVMVAGVIVEAVGVRAALNHPTEAASVAVTVVILGGPALYLTGLVLFKTSLGQGRLGPPIAAVLVLALLALVAGAGADRLLVLVCATAVLGALAVGAALGADRLQDGHKP
jgi:low temperature requirement protein LtrA